MIADDHEHTARREPVAQARERAFEPRQLVSSVALIPDRVGDVSWTPVGVADVNGDGRVDIIWQNVTEGWIGVWLMNGRSLTSSLAFSVERVPDTGWRIVGPR